MHITHTHVLKAGLVLPLPFLPLHLLPASQHIPIQCSAWSPHEQDWSLGFSRARVAVLLFSLVVGTVNVQSPTIQENEKKTVVHRMVGRGLNFVELLLHVMEV